MATLWFFVALGAIALIGVWVDARSGPFVQMWQGTSGPARKPKRVDALLVRGDHTTAKTHHAGPEPIGLFEDFTARKQGTNQKAIVKAQI